MGYRQATRRKRDEGADGISTQRQPPQACTPWWYPCGLMLGGGTVSGWPTMELFPWSRGSSCRELAACAIRRFVVACRVLTPTYLPEIALWEDPLSALGCPPGAGRRGRRGQDWGRWGSRADHSFDIGDKPTEKNESGAGATFQQCRVTAMGVD